MSDETTPGPDPRDVEIERLREELTTVEGQRADYRKTLNRVSDEGLELRAHLAARDHALKLVGEHTETVTAERDQLKATVARMQALADDMRTWCSPHGIAVTYAQRIEEAINPPERDHDALPAVREFVARRDPRHIERPPTITEILDHAAELDRLRRDGGLK